MKHLRIFLILTFVSLLIASCDDGERMRQQLADLQTRNQADSLLTDDSLALALCDYFDSHGTSNERLLAHYLLARTYTDMGEAPRALDEYHRAVECADTTAQDCDYRLLAKVHGQTASLFMQQMMPHEMLEEMRYAASCARMANDTLLWILSMECQHSAYDMLGQSDSAIAVLQSAYRTYRELGHDEEAAYTASTLCIYMVEREDYDKARKYIDFRNTILGNQPTCEDDFFNYYLGLYYLGVGRLDSAEIFFREILNCDIDLNKKEAACKGFVTLYQERENTDSVTKYVQLAYQISDERFRNSNAEDLRKMQALYNYNRNQRIAHEKTLEANHNKMGMILFAFLAILLFLCILAYRYYKKEQIKQMETEYHHLIELQEQAKFDLVKMKDFEKKEILIQKEQEISEYQQAIDHLRSIIKADVSVEPTLANTEIYQHFVFLANHPLEKVYKKDWTELSKIVDECLPRFRSTLFSRYHLSDTDYRLCVLIRLHFSLSEIGILIGESPQYISKRRKSLLKYLFHQEGKPELFDRLLTKIS